MTERLLRRTLVSIALAGLAAGTLAWLAGYTALSGWIWSAGTVPVIVGLAVSMAPVCWRDSWERLAH